MAFSSWCVLPSVLSITVGERKVLGMRTIFAPIAFTVFTQIWVSHSVEEWVLNRVQSPGCLLSQNFNYLSTQIIQTTVPVLSCSSLLNLQRLLNFLQPIFAQIIDATRETKWGCGCILCNPTSYGSGYQTVVRVPSVVLESFFGGTRTRQTCA